MKDLKEKQSMNIPLKARPFNSYIANARTAPMTPKGGDHNDPADSDIAEVRDILSIKSTGLPQNKRREEKDITVHQKVIMYLYDHPTAKQSEKDQKF